MNSTFMPQLFLDNMIIICKSLHHSDNNKFNNAKPYFNSQDSDILKWKYMIKYIKKNIPLYIKIHKFYQLNVFTIEWQILVFNYLPFPPYILISTQRSKHCRKNEVIQISIITFFTFFHNVFYGISFLKSFSSHISVVVCSFFEFGTVSKWCTREWVKCINFINTLTLIYTKSFL